LPVRNGTLRVEAINRRGLAYRVGVRVGDMITAINGELVSHYNKEALFAKLSDRTLRSVEVMRSGQRFEFRF
jgi:C-terminal processing protease CtpA/Prc